MRITTTTFCDWCGDDKICATLGHNTDNEINICEDCAREILEELIGDRCIKEYERIKNEPIPEYVEKFKFEKM